METVNIQKTLIVTGGSQGIGASVWKGFLDRGYKVFASRETSPSRAHRGWRQHNLPQEAPQAFAKAIIEVDGYCSALICVCQVKVMRTCCHLEERIGGVGIGVVGRSSYG